MTNKFNVDGTFSNGSNPQLPACEPEILPPASREAWKPRQAEQINVPDPVIARGFFGRPLHEEFQDEIRQVEQTEKALTALVRTRTAKEQAITEYERTLAGRQHMPALIEQDKLKVFADVTVARSALRRTFQHIARAEEHAAQDALNDERRRQLEAIEFETELEKKKAQRAEAKAKAERAERTAAVRAEAESAEAEKVLHQKRAARDRAFDAYLEGEQHDEAVPPEIEEALEKTSKQQDIRRWQKEKRERVLNAAGRCDGELDAATQDQLDDIDQAAEDASRLANERAAAAVVFPFPEQGER